MTEELDMRLATTAGDVAMPDLGGILRGEYHQAAYRGR
jgi:hypothetical protein